MFGWRGRIGYICPALYFCASEWEQVLPKGVSMVVATLGLEAVVPEEFERLFSLYQSAAEKIAKYEVGFIICGGAPVFTYSGYEKSEKMARSIEKTTGIPTKLQLTNQIDALNKLSAKKIVVASPHEEERNRERKKLLEDVGFDVLSIRATGMRTAPEHANQPPHAAYKLAKEVFLEAPEADAIYIPCPAWEVVADIDTIERDLGKPVVASTSADVWAALTTMQVKGPIEGYGRLLEML